MSLHDLWTANYGGDFLFSVAFFLFWIIFNCAWSIQQFRKTLLTDQLAYGAGRPPTLTRIVQTISAFTLGTAFLIPDIFEAYFVGHRPSRSIPSEGRIYQLYVQGYIAYLTSREHLLVSNYWLLVAGISASIYFSLGAIRGDPFASKPNDVPEVALPKGMIEPAPGWLSGTQILLIVGGYFVAFLSLIAFLIGRAFATF